MEALGKLKSGVFLLSLVMELHLSFGGQSTALNIFTSLKLWDISSQSRYAEVDK